LSPVTYLENRIPPPLVLLLTLLLIRLVAKIDHVLVLSTDLRWAGAGLFTLIGVSIAISAVRQFKRKSTTIDPLHPNEASTLVTGGVFQYTRNPMYLGMLCVLIAAAIYFSSVYGLLLVACFYGYITRFQIIPEERAMIELFGDDYTQFTKTVRRWV